MDVKTVGVLSVCLLLFTLQFTSAPVTSKTDRVDHENGSNSDSDIEEERLLLESVKLGNGNNDATTNIWRCKNGKPVPTALKDYSEFESDETYVVLRMKENSNKIMEDLSREASKYSEMSDIYYWIGERSTDTDACAAASLAIELDFGLHSKINIHREAEGQETSSFKTIFGREQTESDFNVKTAKPLDDNVKTMFLIKEKYVARFEEVNSSLKRYTHEENNCLVLYSKTSVYTYCGNSTSKAQQKVAIELSKWMTKDYEVTIFRDNKPVSELTLEEKHILKQFFEEFTTDSEKVVHLNKDIPVYEKEIETSQLEDVKQVELPIIKIFEEETEKAVKLDSVDGIKMSVSSLSPHECYIIQTGSDIGLFVWMGDESTLDVRQECAKKAEQLLSERKYSHTTPVIFINEHNMNIPPEVDLGDLILLMENAKLPLTWLLKPQYNCEASSTSDQASTSEPPPFEAISE